MLCNSFVMADVGALAFAEWKTPGQICWANFEETNKFTSSFTNDCWPKTNDFIFLLNKLFLSFARNFEFVSKMVASDGTRHSGECEKCRRHERRANAMEK